MLEVLHSVLPSVSVHQQGRTVYEVHASPAPALFIDMPIIDQYTEMTLSLIL